jgi:AmmeMemoRadiSam system protein B/AmmeMemoRadiSam system protein A
MERMTKKTMVGKLLLLTGVLIMFGLSSKPLSEESVRKPAVAGQFYAGNADQLKREIEKYCAGGAADGLSSRLLICPHAGYVFSGPVAGKGYAALDRNVKTVILLGPSHHAWFEGLAVPKEKAFHTPLGNVPIDQDKMKRLLAHPNVRVNSEAHDPEHSVEVQVPFLQVMLKNFSIVPVLTGNITPESAAEIIFPLIDDQTAVIASSDLSHYKAQAEARTTDDKTIGTIMSDNATGFLDACGEMPVRIVMIIAHKMGLKPKLLDARTSYDTYPQYGSNDRVVGYASIVYVKQNHPQKVSPGIIPNEAGLTKETKDFLLTLARKSLAAAVKGEKPPIPENIPAITREERGCFVTLTVNNELRGCIGYIEPIKPLYQAVIENAKNAALSDPRFPRVTVRELPMIKVEVSVLTKPVVLEHSGPQDLLDKLVPDVDGVILQKGMHQSTYLPQVWEHFSGDKTAFLKNLSLKAGMDADGWKTSNVKRYRAEHFSE